MAAVFCEFISEHAFVLRVSNGSVVAVTDSMCARLGWSRDELVSRRHGAQLLWREQTDYATFVSEVRERRVARSRVIPLVTRQGEAFEMTLSTRVVSSGGELFAILSAPDLADRKRIEAEHRATTLALDAAVTELATVLGAVGDGVITTDGWGRVLALNSVAERLTQWRAKDAHTRPLREVFRVKRPGRGADLPDPFSDVLNRRREAASWPRATLIARDGTPREIAESVAGLRRHDGEGFGIVVVFRDMTAQTRLDAELQKSQRFEALGVLAGGIAHDINNVLTGILGNLGVVRNRTQDPFVETRLAGAENAAVIVRGMTRQLLSLARGSEPTRSNAGLRAILDEAIAIGLSGSSSRAKLTMDEDDFALYVDALQISRVFQNLVLNASQAMPSGGVVKISATRIKGEPLEGDFVSIKVTDHGPGIPENVRDRIFEPYFTTKPSGTGLGLAVAQSIIAHHAGWLDLQSTPTGTTFECILPLFDETEKSVVTEVCARDSLVAPPVARRGLRVLLLEDDPMVSEATLDMLHELGSFTVHAESGEEALAAFERARGTASEHIIQPFDVLLVDLTLRGATGGVACLTKLRAAGCKAPAILTSGYARPDDIAAWLKDGFDAALPKPYSIDELRHAIERLTPVARLGPARPAASVDGEALT